MVRVVKVGVAEVDEWRKQEEVNVALSGWVLLEEGVGLTRIHAVVRSKAVIDFWLTHISQVSVTPVVISVARVIGVKFSTVDIDGNSSIDWWPSNGLLRNQAFNQLQIRPNITDGSCRSLLVLFDLVQALSIVDLRFNDLVQCVVELAQLFVYFAELFLTGTARVSKARMVVKRRFLWLATIAAESEIIVKPSLIVCLGEHFVFEGESFCGGKQSQEN